MQFVGILVAVLLAVSGLAAAGSTIWLLVVAFRRSVVWGLVSLFVPFGQVAFVVMNWNEAKKPFLISIASVALVFCIIGTSVTGTILTTKKGETTQTDDAGKREQIAK